MSNPNIVSRDQWLKLRLALLEKEKELTRLRDEVSQQRQALPWVEVTSDYRFNGADGELTLLDLFGQCRQLMVYHFMYGEDWEEGCTSCTFWADNFNGIDVHLAHRDISFLAVSNASYPTLASYAQRFGWDFRWVSAGGSSFSQDFNVSFDAAAREQNRIHYNYKDQDWYMDELPGVSVFIRDEANQVFHTYSTYARGLDILNGAYNYIDLAPLGRHEENGMSWLRRRDQYTE